MMPQSVKIDLCLEQSKMLFDLDATKLIIRMKISAKLRDTLKNENVAIF